MRWVSLEKLLTWWPLSRTALFKNARKRTSSSTAPGPKPRAHFWPEFSSIDGHCGAFVQPGQNVGEHELLVPIVPKQVVCLRVEAKRLVGGRELIEPGANLLRAKENILASSQDEAGRFHLGRDLSATFNQPS